MTLLGNICEHITHLKQRIRHCDCSPLSPIILCEGQISAYMNVVFSRIGFLSTSAIDFDIQMFSRVYEHTFSNLLTSKTSNYG